MALFLRPLKAVSGPFWGGLQGSKWPPFLRPPHVVNGLSFLGLHRQSTASFLHLHIIWPLFLGPLYAVNGLSWASTYSQWPLSWASTGSQWPLFLYTDAAVGEECSLDTSNSHAVSPVHLPNTSSVAGVTRTAAQVQFCFTSSETKRTIRDGEPRTAASTFTQLLGSELVTADGKESLCVQPSMQGSKASYLFRFMTGVS